MKLLDIILENEETSSISDYEIDKLKKMRMALKSGKIEFSKDKVYTYELLDNYEPHKTKNLGKIGYIYQLADRPFGIQVYKIENNKKIPLFDKLSGEDFHAIFRGGKWDNVSKYAVEYNRVFKHIQLIFVKFGLYIWTSVYK